MLDAHTANTVTGKDCVSTCTTANAVIDTVPGQVTESMERGPMLAAPSARPAFLARSCPQRVQEHPHQSQDVVMEVDSEDHNCISRREASVMLRTMALGRETEDLILESLYEHNDCEVTENRLIASVLDIHGFDHTRLRKILRSMKMFRDAFHRCDMDGSGKLELNEVRLLLKRLGKYANEAMEMMAMLDKDRSGAITWLEFVEGFTSPEFNRRFEDVKIEDVAVLPELLDATRNISTEEQMKALHELPTVEKFVVWFLQRQFRGTSSKKAAQHRSSRVSGAQYLEKRAEDRRMNNDTNSRDYELAVVSLRTACSDMSRISFRQPQGCALDSCLDTQGENFAPAIDNTVRRTRTSWAYDARCLKAFVSDGTRSIIMREQKRKAHTLTSEQRWWLRLVVCSAKLAAIVAGIVAALLADLVETFAEREVGNQTALFNCITLIGSCIWSLIEVLTVCFAGVLAVTQMVKLAELQLWPLSRERALVAGALARAALKLGHPQSSHMGVDPRRGISKWSLLLASLVYFGKRSVTKFFARLAVKKVAPRAALKSVDAIDLLVCILVNVVFNHLTMTSCMTESITCCFGPSAIIDMVISMIDEWQTATMADDDMEPMSDTTKLMAMRTVGVVVAHRGVMHANHRYMLSYLSSLFADDYFRARVRPTIHEDVKRLTQLSESQLGPGRVKETGQCCCRVRRINKRRKRRSAFDGCDLAPLMLDNKDVFLDGLSRIQGADLEFILQMMVVAVIVDGFRSRSEFALLRQAAACCKPPREASWSHLARAAKYFVSGRSLLPKDLASVFGMDHDTRGCTSQCVCQQLCRDATRCLNVF